MTIKVTYNVTDVYVSENVSATYINVSYETPSSGGGSWGTITGTLSTQTDLQNALNAKYNTPTGTTLQYLRGDGTLATFPTIPSGTVQSVGLSMPSAFSVANSPVTSSGTLAVTGAGTASQYIRGDGQLANFPDNQGGGSSVNYYLNGSVTQGTFGGITYYEMSKTPILGAGTNFTRTNAQGNGYIASFITDAGDPSLLNIPGGNWNVEFYFQSSSTGGSPQFYAELYKVDASNNFTLVGSGSTNPEGITNGTTIDQYFTSIPVPQTSLLVTDRLAIRIFVIPSGRTITLHTENSNLCEVLTTLSTGLNALNGLTSQVQYFATGTSGTDFAISSATDTHTFNLPTASATNRGALSSADWTTFNNKQAALGFTPVTNARTLTINGVTQDLSANRTFTIPTDSTQLVEHLLVLNNGYAYSNGSSGVGATLQQADYTNANPVINGNQVVLNDRILVALYTNSVVNGLYYYSSSVLLEDGDGIFYWLHTLTRMVEYDQPSDFAKSIFVRVTNKTYPNLFNVFIGSITPVTTIGTSEILFTPVDKGRSYGTLAQRPSNAFYPGQIYFQTDGSGGQYVFNGSSWEKLATTPNLNFVVQHLQQASYADNTTYYFGGQPILPTTTSTGRTRGVFNKSGIFRGYTIYLSSTTIPSSETITITIFKATGIGALSSITTNTFSWGGTNNRVFTSTGISSVITAGDTYEFSIQIPLMATNPANVVVSGNIELELT